MVVDNTVNLFQIADVSRLLVIANCPEDDLPTLEALRQRQRRWTVRTVGTKSSTGLSGNHRRDQLHHRPQSAHGDHQGVCREPRTAHTGGAIRHRHREHPAAGRRGRDPRRCPGRRRQAELGVRAARCGQAPVYDAARPRDASVRPHGVRAEHADPQGRAIDGPRRRKRASCRKSPCGRASASSRPGRWNSNGL